MYGDLATEHEESRGLRGKLERSRAPCAAAAASSSSSSSSSIMMTKDTFATSPAIIVAENATLTNTWAASATRRRAS